jgi:Dockerin type I domain
MLRSKSLMPARASALSLSAIASFIASLSFSASGINAQVNFQQNANGQSYSDSFLLPLPHTDTGTFPNDNDWSQSYTTSADSYGDLYESAPSNWSTPYYPGSLLDPNLLNDNVDLGSNAVTLDVTVTIGTLNINAGGSLAVNYAQTLTLGSLGSALTDNGSIVVNTGHLQTPAIIDFVGGTVSGTGQITLNAGGYGAAQINGLVTQSVGHTIDGTGMINAALTNNGFIDADVNAKGLSLTTSPMTNNNLMVATDGGNLAIRGITVTQTATGQIIATNGSAVNLDGDAMIMGGTLSSSGTGIVQALGYTDTIGSLTDNAALYVPASTTLNVAGNLTNNGTMYINIDQVAADAIVSFDGGTISGGGSIALSSAAYAQVEGTLTQSAGHTISGTGLINAAITNNGTVNANVAGQTLTVNGVMMNGGLAQASNGGTLQFSPGSLTNFAGATLTGGAYEADANSTIILPGSVTTNAAAITLGGPGASIPAINSLSSNSGSLSLSNGATYATASDFNNSGTVSVDSSSALAVNGGYAQSAGLTKVNGTMTVNSGNLAISGGTLDLDGTLLVNYGSGADPAATIRQDLINGRGANTWTGTGGISSSAAAANPAGLAVGYADGSNPIDAAETGLAPGQIEVKYTVAGDVNLDGRVDLSDLLIVSSNIGITDADWAEGDLNYDGNVDLSDLVIVASHFGASLSSLDNADFSAPMEAELRLAFAEVQGADVSVPEPCLLGLAAVGTLALVRRPRNARQPR